MNFNFFAKKRIGIILAEGLRRKSLDSILVFELIMKDDPVKPIAHASLANPVQKLLQPPQRLYEHNTPPFYRYLPGIKIPTSTAR